MGEANEWSEEKEVFEDVQLEAKKADIEKFIACGVVSKNLLEVLEVFTAPAVTPEHVLNPACKTCNKCTICFETGGQTFMEKMQTEAFKAHIWRIPNQERDAAKYRYRIKYISDPNALPLPDNYQISYMQHLSLRNAFSKLELEAQEEQDQGDQCQSPGI